MELCLLTFEYILECISVLHFTDEETDNVLYDL